jgi:hypothetical protein
MPEGDFKVTLQKITGTEGLGCLVTYPEKKYLQVDGVKDEGLVATHNRSNENTPEVLINKGDAIIVINGVYGNSDLMLAELKSDTITLLVKRGKPAAAAVEAPAAEVVPAAAEAVEFQHVSENPVVEELPAPAQQEPAAEEEPAVNYGPSPEGQKAAEAKQSAAYVEGEDFSKLSVKELKARLASKGVSCAGIVEKSELVAACQRSANMPTLEADIPADEEVATDSMGADGPAAAEASAAETTPLDTLDATMAGGLHDVNVACELDPAETTGTETKQTICNLGIC